MIKYILFVFTAECPGLTWGDDCTNTCTCDNDKSSDCSHVTGCVCNTGWTGVNCDEDIDECTEKTASCQDNSNCTNTQGSYECPCVAGFILRSSGGNTVCEGMHLTFSKILIYYI